MLREIIQQSKTCKTRANQAVEQNRQWFWCLTTESDLINIHLMMQIRSNIKSISFRYCWMITRFNLSLNFNYISKTWLCKKIWEKAQKGQIIKQSLYSSFSFSPTAKAPKWKTWHTKHTKNLIVCMHSEKKNKKPRKGWMAKTVVFKFFFPRHQIENRHLHQKKRKKKKKKKTDTRSN